MPNLQRETMLNATGNTTGAWFAIQRQFRNVGSMKIDFDPNNGGAPHSVTVRVEGRHSDPSNPLTPDEANVTLMSVTEQELGTSDTGGSHAQQVLLMPYMRVISENNDNAANLVRAFLNE